MEYFVNILILLLMTLCLYQFFCKHKVYVDNDRQYYTYKPNTRVVKGFYLLIFSLIIVFFFCLRFIGKIDDMYYGGIDAEVYRDRFMAATGGLIQSLKSQGNEPVYGLLVYLVRLFTDNFIIFLLVYYFLMCFLIFNALSKIDMHGKWYFIGLFIAVSLPLFDSMNIMRNQLAYFFVMNSYIYFQKKKMWTAGFFEILAVGCHISAIMFVLYMAVYLFKNSERLSYGATFAFIVVMSVVCVLMLSVIKTLFSGSRYVMYFSSGALPKMILAQRLLVIFSLMLYMHSNCNRELYDTLWVLVYTSIIIVILQSFIGIIYRANIYYDIMYLLLPMSLYPDSRLLVNKKIYESNIKIKVGSTKNRIINMQIIKTTLFLLLITNIAQAVMGFESYGLLHWKSIL